MLELFYTYFDPFVSEKFTTFPYIVAVLLSKKAPEFPSEIWRFLYLLVYVFRN